LTRTALVDRQDDRADRDTFHGRFVRLVPDTEVVQVVEFETDDPARRER
jgi:hypothetical protein